MSDPHAKFAILQDKKVGKMIYEVDYEICEICDNIVTPGNCLVCAAGQCQICLENYGCFYCDASHKEAA
jgi:hypothetical protein